MTSQQWGDDDHLLAALGEAVRAARAVPPEFTAAGQAAFTWRTIDAELAALTFDSAAAEPAVAVRAEEASPRFLTFAGSELTIELEIGSDSIVGQITPAGSGHVDACPAAGPAMMAEIDEIGCFIIRPLPPSPFRLHCHLGSGSSVLTTWITL